MICQVEIDVSAERNSKRTLAKLLIGVMLVAGVTPKCRRRTSTKAEKSQKRRGMA